ncbi:hypothetical protein B0T14DRAFT_511900 [Immersiella caudata]|uniref:SET domain-containing protein n=1 Tax=Immersiella caudata TaxID=314043 RepID=A0AA40C6U9_9PEZI|nr:hypothetical protein B0T14DRAFT_511900 [Immersiella caudata]
MAVPSEAQTSGGGPLINSELSLKLRNGAHGGPYLNELQDPVQQPSESELSLENPPIQPIKRNPARGAHHKGSLAYKTCKCTEDCIACENRGRRILCNKSNCQLEGRCSNRIPRRKTFPRHEVFRTNDRGDGLRILEEVPSGVVVEEYTGKVVQPCDISIHMKAGNKYLLEADGIAVDGSNGSDARFINHSHSPNCTIEKWEVSGSTRFFVTSKRTIRAGEEITIDYGIYFLILKCCCGEEACPKRNGKSWEIRDVLGKETVFSLHPQIACRNSK